jgi:hypothetical protein
MPAEKSAETLGIAQRAEGKVTIHDKAMKIYICVLKQIIYYYYVNYLNCLRDR